MKIYFLTDEALSVIKENIDVYLDYFKESTNESLVKRVKEASQKEDIFKATSYDVVDNIEEILINNISGADDTKNAILLHSVLKDLPPTIACDERFWAGFAIHSCWNFVRKRWHMDTDVTKSGVLTHFLFMANSKSALMRNALARLWWIGYLTHDDSRANCYELTRRVCENSDYILNLFERSFSNSPKVLRTFIDCVHEIRIDRKIDKYPLELVREICKYVNLLGGIYILETLPTEVLKTKMKMRAKAYLEK